MSFNLTTEKWIPVILQDWTLEEVSLIELFKNWQSYREIKADNPPTTLALYRFLLAILHRAYIGPKDIYHWEEIKEDDGKVVIKYLQNNADCFDLFHSEKPFMQDPALKQVKEPVPIYVYSIFQFAKKPTVFSHLHLWSDYGVSFAEASQILVRTHTLDVSGTRAFYPPKTKGNRSASQPSTINSANIMIIGNNIGETLLLNLVQYDPKRNKPKEFTGDDVPFWEIGYSGKPQEKEDDANGYLRYLTYPWRRLLLYRNGDHITKIAVTMGNSLEEKVKYEWDSGIAYYKGQPIKLSHQKSLWRNAHTFLPSPVNNKDFLSPRVVNWNAKLYANKIISNNYCLLQVIGLAVNKSNVGEPEFWTDERLSVPSIYLEQNNLWNALKTIIDIAEDYKKVFSWGGDKPYGILAKALNNHQAEKLAKSLDGESRYWLILDQKFTELLDALPKDKQTLSDGTISYGNQELSKWRETVKKAARDAFTESIQSIRNYEARAKALQRLNYQLKKIEGNDDEKPKKSKKSRKKG